MKFNVAMMKDASQRSEDLRHALGRDGLAELVRTALPASRERITDATLLAALTYSYAAGVYDSTEISYELGECREWLGAELKIDQHMVRQFRRRHRSELRECLSHVLRRARRHWTERPLEATASRWSGGSQDACEQEAEERISRAVRADTYALDD